MKIPNTLSARIRLLKWLFPIAAALLVVVFQLGIAPWIEVHFSNQTHFWVELLFYGTSGPTLAFLLLHFLERWLEERETSELQAQVISEVREHALISRELNDEALQALFAASVLLTSLKQSMPAIPTESATALQETERGLDRAVQQIRLHLQSGPVRVQEREEVRVG